VDRWLFEPEADRGDRQEAIMTVGDLASLQEVLWHYLSIATETEDEEFLQHLVRMTILEAAKIRSRRPESV
jgi:hypothetical protein